MFDTTIDGTVKSQTHTDFKQSLANSDRLFRGSL